MGIDWTKGPDYQEISQIRIPDFEVSYLDNGIKCIIVNTGSQEFFKIELVFRGGRFLELKKLSNKMCSALMREGTTSRSSIEIAESIDFYGANLRMSANLDHTSISIIGLSKFIPEIIPIVADILFNPVFPHEEIEKYRKNQVEKLQHDLSRNDILSYRLFTEIIFGSNDQYGYNTSEQYLNELSQQDLFDFHSRAFGHDNCFIIASGYLPKNIISILNESFGRFINVSTPLNERGQLPEIKEKRVFANSKNAHQASIKIGKRLFKKGHIDLPGFFVMNTILGGYFGSRLMTKIREDLGLTYNISSTSDFMLYDGYFYIETDVAVDKIEETIEEVYKQIEILKSELVDNSELSMVKNYLIGNFLHLVDGPLNIGGFLKTLELENSNFEKFQEFISTIRTMQPETIMKIAKKYLVRETMTEVIVKP